MDICCQLLVRHKYEDDELSPETKAACTTLSLKTGDSEWDSVTKARLNRASSRPRNMLPESCSLISDTEMVRPVSAGTQTCYRNGCCAPARTFSLATLPLIRVEVYYLIVYFYRNISVHSFLETNGFVISFTTYVWTPQMSDQLVTRPVPTQEDKI